MSQKMHGNSGPITHGLSRHRLHNVWSKIKSRCGNPKRHNYSRYGGRGISVHPEWRDNFLSFYTWAIENGWEEGLQIDRIDNNGNYEPANCRIVTPKENARNRRDNIYLNINGIMATISEHAERAGLTRNTVWYRYKRGWKPGDLLIPRTDNFQRRTC